ncbi:hypothetical protein CRM22_009151 [Opisthorchis felineus]|uniref:MD-2-related lipid-recognition domain-containing protein n=1 Tax=Opisthorchis felineus TaxID=147828 RepID=A0A4S2L844_OPIFE|nr:hypothetical protein CRM22_009151 [Opisthorchis felineus]
MGHILILLTCGVIFGVSDVMAVNFRDCDSVGARVLSVDIVPCNDEPCVLYRGRSASINIAFAALADVDVRGSTLQSSFGRQRIRIPMPSNGMCGPVNRSCFIQAGGVYTYTFTAVVPENVRPGSMTIRWELLNTSDQAFLCFEITVLIV